MNDSVTTEGGQATLKKQLTVVAVLCLLAGLALGLLALAGPLAVWFGMADFRLGFGFLQIVNGWADWVAGITFCVGVAIIVSARMKGIAAGPKLAALALGGCVIAALAWYIPETFRPPEGTPPIHDIATDPNNPLPFVAIAPLRADAANNMEYGVMPGIDSVQQHIDMQTSAYPDIVPQVFAASPDEVFQRALDAVDTMGWELVEADPQSGRIEATDTTFWFRFKDDVVIQVTANDSGQTVLQARSLSRVGRSDVGKNAARLREFFSLLQS